MRRENKIVPRLAVYLALMQNGKFLFIRRANTGYADGKLSLVAGHVEDGEGLKAAMIREAFEEVGIEITPDNLTFEHLQYRNSGDGKLYVDVFFRAGNWTGTIVNKEPHKCSEFVWCDSNSIPGDCIEHVKLVLIKIRSSQEPHFSEFDESLT